MDSKTADFIEKNANADTRMLALRKAPEGVDLAFALDQIEGRRRAVKKLPSLAAVNGIVYPPHLSMEQCSSERTALYKADVAKRICAISSSADSVKGAKRMVDLTGGFGIDFIYMSRAFDEAVYVERQEHLCSIARYNFDLLAMGNAKIVNADGTSYLETMKHADLVYIDPARRDDRGGRTFAISDCTPDVSAIIGLLKAKADNVMIKLSPMLDWRKAVEDVGGNVSEVHIVSVDNECKELLIVVNNGSEPLKLYCVNITSDVDVFVSTPMEERNIELPPPVPLAPKIYLYEPNSSIMKAGCFDEMGEKYAVSPISANSHLFVSSLFIGHFPGRTFVVEAVSTMNKQELRRSLSSIKKANVATRNFPMSVADLRKRLKLSDGGDTYIFATTTADGSHILLICKKL